MKKSIRLLLIDNPCKPYRNSTISKFQVNIINCMKTAFDKFKSEAGYGYKGVAKDITKTDWNISICNRMCSCYGITSYTTLCCKRIVFSIDLKFSTCLINKPPRILYETVSHEIAHGIDYLMRGDSFHDEPWRKIHRMLGGSGRTFIF